MKISDLESLYEVYENKNFSKAASKAGYSISAVSKQVHRIESELGTELFDRDKKNTEVAVTPEGEALMPYIQDIIFAYRKLMFEARNRHTNQPGSLSIATPALIGTIGETEILTNFYDDNTDVALNITTNKSHTENIQDLMQGTIDGVFMLIMGSSAQSFSLWEELCSEDFSIIKILTNDNLYIGMSMDNKLADKEEISINDLQDETFIFSTAQKNPYDSRIMDLQKLSGCDPSSMKKRFMDFSNQDLVLNMVEKGNGVLPQIVLPLNRGHKIKYVKVAKWPDSLVGVFVSRKSNKSPALKCFKKYVRNYAKEHAGDNEI